MKLKKLAMVVGMVSTMLSMNSIKAFANTVFIGDSRTVGIYDTLHGTSTANKTNVNVTDADGTTWSCKVSMGLKWMKSTGVPQVEDKIHEDTDVVILMGVNDAADANMAYSYAEYLNLKSAEWADRGAEVHYVSVMPLRNDTKYETNAGIVIWNELIKNGLSDNVDYIDMSESGIAYDFRDAWHFKSNTSREIYSYLTASV